MIRHAFRRFLALGLCIVLAASPAFALAHSGRTDARGGHKDNKNKSGLGSYHYHCGGHPAHLHQGGVCPYASGSTAAKSAKSSSGASSSAKASKAASGASSRAASSQSMEQLIRDAVEKGIVSPSQDDCVSITAAYATKTHNVRQKPSADSKKLGQFAKGEEIPVIKPYYEPQWHQVIYNGKVGYVHANYSTLSDTILQSVRIDAGE